MTSETVKLVAQAWDPYAPWADLREAPASHRAPRSATVTGVLGRASPPSS